MKLISKVSARSGCRFFPAGRVPEFMFRRSSSQNSGFPPDRSNRPRNGQKKRAQRFVAVTFFILSLYILFESVSKLWTPEKFQSSAAGIIIAILSIIIMPLPAWKKEAIGIAIGSRALIADSKETITCAFLSVALLLGFGANWFFSSGRQTPWSGSLLCFSSSAKDTRGGPADVRNARTMADGPHGQIIRAF